MNKRLGSIRIEFARNHWARMAIPVLLAVAVAWVLAALAANPARLQHLRQIYPGADSPGTLPVTPLLEGRKDRTH